MQKSPLEMTGYPSPEKFVAEDDAKFLKWQRLVIRLLLAACAAFISWIVYFLCLYRLVIIHR